MDEKINTLKQYIKWIFIVILRDIILPLFGKTEWEVCGSVSLMFENNGKEWSEPNFICFKLKDKNIYKVYSPWKYWNHYMCITYLISLVDTGVWTWDDFCEFMEEEW